jgi:hypothetical protein
MVSVRAAGLIAPGVLSGAPLLCRPVQPSLTHFWQSFGMGDRAYDNGRHQRSKYILRKT